MRPGPRHAAGRLGHPARPGPLRPGAPRPYRGRDSGDAVVLPQRPGHLTSGRPRLGPDGPDLPLPVRAGASRRPCQKDVTHQGALTKISSDTAGLLSCGTLGPVNLHVGCAMWTHAPWQGRYLPPALSPRDRLSAYATWCNAVEGNTTFYATPAPGTVKSWAEQTAPDFRFIFK